MKRIAIFLLLGAIVNVGVAWGVACNHELKSGYVRLPGSRPIPFDTVLAWQGGVSLFGSEAADVPAEATVTPIRFPSWPGGTPKSWPQPWYSEHEHSLAVERSFFETKQDTKVASPWFTVDRLRAGWPMRSMQWIDAIKMNPGGRRIQDRVVVGNNMQVSHWA